MSRTRYTFPNGLWFLFAFVFLAATALAKDTPFQVVDWPSTGTPVLRFTFNKLKQYGSVGTQRSYSLDTTAQNLSAKLIPAARFSVYLFDKNKVRIGEETISVNNVGPGETVKFETNMTVSGAPAFLSIRDLSQEAKSISMTVNSSPQGADLKVDGTEAGSTPRVVKVTVGKHILTFSKEGFNSGNFPLEISSSDASGGSVTYEMGTSTFDTIELRDGSVLNGDLVSISGMDVEVRIGGSIQHVDRNKIKRVMLTQRDLPISNPSAFAPPTQ